MLEQLVRQEMHTDLDTLVITDPCYILNESHWEHWLNLYSNQLDNRISLVDYMHKYLDFGEVIAADTGVGDWSMDVYNTDTREVIGSFTADAGMVCVVTMHDLTRYGYDKEEIARLHDIGCLAFVDNFCGDVTLDYDKHDVAYIIGVGETEEDINFTTQDEE